MFKPDHHLPVLHGHLSKMVKICKCLLPIATYLNHSRPKLLS